MKETRSEQATRLKNEREERRIARPCVSPPPLKPLVLEKAPYRRPTYQAEAGVVIREGMTGLPIEQAASPQSIRE